MDAFQRSIFALLQALPLASCRRPAGRGRFVLPVLLVGGRLTGAKVPESDRLFMILGEILAMGQFLDTDLSVTLLTPDAAAAWNELKSRAPYLLYFATVTCDGTVLQPETTGPDEDTAGNAPKIPAQKPIALAKLQLVSGRADPASLSGLPGAGAYCIVCTGSDAENRTLCAAAHVLWPTAQTVCVQKDGFARCIGPAAFVPVAAQNDRLYQLGLLQHYTYCKHINPHRPFPEIRQEFAQEGYNRAASLRAALHFDAKLYSVGITTADPAQAARQLAQKLADDSRLVDRFAYLEHNRWVLTKVMDGYSFPKGKIWENIYKADRVRTTHDEATRLHTALVPCDEKSHLTAQNFDDVCSGIRPDVDALDRVTLEIHKNCRELGKKRWKGEEGQSDGIRVLLEKLDAAVRGLPEPLEKLQQNFKNLRAAVREAYKGEAYACALFEREKEKMKNWLKNAGSQPGTAEIAALLAQLEEQMGPQLEYVLRKDFKDLDRFLCRTIPFQMTYKPDFHLVKFLTENTFCDLFSLYDQEPGTVDFVGLAGSGAETERLVSHAKKIKDFLRQYCPGTMARFTVYGPGDAAALSREAAEIGLVLQPAAGSGLQNLLYTFLQKTRPDYIETTGLGQQALFAVFAAASEADVPMFYMEESRPKAPDGGILPLAYPRPEKPLSVAALIDMGGKQEGSEGASFDVQLAEKPETKKKKSVSPMYWQIFKAAMDCPDWNRLCDAVSGQIAKSRWDAVLAPVPDNAGMVQTWEKTLTALAKCGAVTLCPQAGALCFRSALPAMAEILKSSGRVLEAALYYAALGSCRFHDVDIGRSFWTSSNGEERKREVDVIACSGKTAYFISCKMGTFLQENGRLDARKYQYVLDEIYSAAALFAQGARVVPVLAAPRIRMQSTEKNTDSAFVRARKSGVILFGEERFQSSRTLLQAMIHLADGTAGQEF